MRKKAGVIALIIMLAGVLAGGCGNKFDAKGYVQAVLDEKFQGEFEDAARIMEMTQYELKEDYENEIRDFVYIYLTGGYEELSDYAEYEYETIVKEIFSVMKYEVKKADKTGKREYEVAVEIRPTDIFLTYVEKLKALSEEIEKSAANGGYEGSGEEIEQQMENDYLNQAPVLLEESYANMQYSEKKTVIVKVSGNKENVYSISEEEFDNLTEQFFRMDEIQP